MNWLPIYAVSPFWRMARHFLEMRYLWNKPHRMDGAAMHTVLPDFVQTPVAEAVGIAASFQIDPDKAVVRAVAA
jgi:hypothetical protein